MIKKLDIKPAVGLLDSTFGMLLSKNSNGIILKTRFGIHTFFMKKSIDVLILDHQNKVVKIKFLKPFRIFLWNPKFDTVVELPEGSIKRLEIKIGKEISF